MSNPSELRHEFEVLAQTAEVDLYLFPSMTVQGVALDVFDVPLRRAGERVSAFHKGSYLAGKSGGNARPSDRGRPFREPDLSWSQSSGVARSAGSRATRSIISKNSLWSPSPSPASNARARAVCRLIAFAPE